AIAGRDHVLPDDVQALAVPVLAHRVLPSAESRLAGRTTQDIVVDLVRRVPVPAAVWA
ncbi:MAG: ATPase, partial [Micrococcales bacterium]|nr:ATPase [Micrococcales bacterium]